MRTDSKGTISRLQTEGRLVEEVRLEMKSV